MYMYFLCMYASLPTSVNVTLSSSTLTMANFEKGMLDHWVGLIINMYEGNNYKCLYTNGIRKSWIIIVARH